MDKRFINEANQCVDESIRGFVRTFPGLYYHEQFRFVTKSKLEVTQRVAVLSGGGSGHEPFCTGYVGDGMLAGAVAGNVFTSPPKAHVLQAITFLSQYYKGGVLVIIPNYTGDCLNFGMAIENARNCDIAVESVIVGDDWASVEKSSVGGRGMCGLLFAFKIAGAWSEQGKTLSFIADNLTKLMQNVSTLGITSKPCCLPGQGPLFHIKDDEMELGTGVHGEAGILGLKVSSAREAVKIILSKLLETEGAGSKTSLVILVNTLGSTTEIERNIICNDVYNEAVSKEMLVERVYAGNLMTSLDMCGFQISILRLPESMKKCWLSLLDAKTDAPRWVGSQMSMADCEYDIAFNYRETSDIDPETSNIKFEMNQSELLYSCLSNVAKALLNNESKLNDLDSGCGDGDCGSTMKILADGLLNSISIEDCRSPAKVLRKLANIAETKMGGTSGALYSLCFSSMRHCFMRPSDKPLPVVWSESWNCGLEAIKKYGHAKLGDRTIIDAMQPATETFGNLISQNCEEFRVALRESLTAARVGCDKTKDMQARLGRASYVNAEHLKNVDAGAYGFVICLEAAVECFD